MKIVSLLPSATEIVCALGLREQLAGVSHECDWPPSVVGLPVLTRSSIPPGLSSAEIDRQVTAQLEEESSLYGLEMERLRAIAPDLVVTQALCDVCAVSGDEVARAIGTLPGSPRIVNLEPACLSDVLQTLQLVADAAGCTERGKARVAALQARIDAVAERTASLPAAARPRVAALDWLDPLFSGGHWTPEIIALAGGEPCFGPAGEPSRRLSWEEFADAAPEIVLIALCGFDEARTLADARSFLEDPRWRAITETRAPRVLMLDGNAYFSRPGPRLVDSLEILAHALHPDLHPLPAGMAPAHTLGAD